MIREICRTIAFGLLALVLSVSMLPPKADAGSGAVGTLPGPRQKAKTRLKLQVDTEWVDGNGYRPVTVRISPLGGGPAPADRMVQVKLRPQGWQWGTFMPTVTTWVEILQGDVAGEQTVAVPQYESWNAIAIETFEDDKLCQDLCGQLGMNLTGPYQWSEAAPAMLFIDSDAPRGGRGARFPAKAKKDKTPQRLPDVRSLASLFMLEYYGNALDKDDFDTKNDLDDNGVLKLLDQLGRVHIVRPDGLPKNWIEYTAVDVMFVSWSDLQSLQQEAESWKAIRDWLATGPTLCVFGVGEDFEHLQALEGLFGLNSPSEEPDPLARGWRKPALRDYSSEIFALRNVDWNGDQWYVQPMNLNVNQPNKAVESPPAEKPEDQQPFLIHNVERGRVVALSTDNPFPGTRLDWSWVFNSLSQDDWMWYKRHGFSFHRDNDQYWNLLIPGVGDAPVNSFLVMISLFVVVIGPVNYFLLQRRRRLYLLLLTVPLGAGLVTMALMMYAVVNDGLSVRVRTRSLTSIDQTSGQSVTWSRQSYYAGLTPSAGMVFPPDVAVYPIDHRPKGRNGRSTDRRRLIDWDVDQVLARGYLNSRSTAQFLVIEPRETESHLEFTNTDDDTTTPRVTNHLGVDIEMLLVIDAFDRALACQQLPNGRAVQLSEVDEDTLAEHWGKVFARNRPRYPEGFDPDQIDTAATIFGANYYWQAIDQGLADPSMITSVLERGLRGMAKLDFNKLQPRSYIAIVREAPEMSLGTESVQEEASFHVVKGKW
jgi:hypothetical protein